MEGISNSLLERPFSLTQVVVHSNHTKFSNLFKITFVPPPPLPDVSYSFPFLIYKCIFILTNPPHRQGSRHSHSLLDPNTNDLSSTNNFFFILVWFFSCSKHKIYIPPRGSNYISHSYISLAISFFFPSPI